MSWINSNATYKQNSKNDLSFYHGFSKTPVEPTSTGTAATTLANASTKGGHTVIGTEVWAEEIPWFGLVASRAAAVTRLSGLTKLNDLVKVDGEGGKVYKYKGADDATFTEDTWADFWEEVTLTNGMELMNRHKQPVLRYYLNQPMQTLTTTNNASIDSKGFATRLFVNESNHLGQTSGGSVVSQFAAGTDNIKNGIPSVELNPKLYLGTTEKIAGTHYYDYNVSGTILWSTAVTSSSPKISCFRYIGKTVTGQLATVETSLSKHTADISDIKLALGLEDTNPDGTQSVTARVETVEDVVRVLLGLGDSEAIVASESIATTANTAASTAISGALEEGGSIATEIATAVSAAEGRVKVTTDALAGRIAQLEGVKLSVQVVDALPEVPVINTIYLVDEDGSTTGTYVEYIAYKPEGSETVITERIGTTAVDLEGYTTDAEHTALADRVTALDAATTGRVAVVEGKVSTLEGQVSTLTAETIPAIQQSVTDARTYAEQKASAAQTAATTAASQALATARGEITAEIATAKSGAESTAAIALAAAVEQIGKDIEAAKAEAISKAEVTITAGTGIVVTPEGKGTTFEISVSDAVATASDLTALTGRVTTLETTTVPGIDTRLQAAEATITSLTKEDGVIAGIESEIEALAGEAGRVTTVEGKVSDIETSLAEGGTTANAIKAAQDTADAKVASVTVASAPNGVSFSSGTTPALTITTASWEKEPGGYSFVGTGGRLITGDTALSVAQNVADDVKSQSLAQTGALSGMFSVTTAGTVGTGITSITITDDGITQAIADAKSGAEQTAATALSTARGEITTEIGTAISGVEGKSLASTSTGSDLVTITTTGTVGTGMTTTVDTTALATAISTAESNAISAASAAAKAMTLSASDTDDAGKVTVTLGGTVETPTITVTTSDIASATTLSNLVNTVNEHIENAAGLYLSVEKVDVLPADENAKTNKIYLVPVDTEAGRAQNIHTEYIWTNGKWEIIGTTAIDINSLEAAAGAAQTAADKAQEEVDALETVVATLTQTHADDKAALEGSITGINDTIAAMDSAETVNGLTVTQVDGKITGITETLITASVPEGTTSVEGNIAYVGSEKHVIAPEKFQTAAQMPNTLTSWVADLSNLTDGSLMFASCSNLTTFIGDLSSLENAHFMFSHCNLSVESLEFIADSLPEIVSDPVGLTKGMICLGNTTDAHAAAIAEIESKGWTIQEDIIVSPN